MHPRAREFTQQVAEQFDEDIAVTEFEAGTETAADAADAIGCDVAQIASSLVFLVDDEPVVVVASGTTHVSEDRLARQHDGESVTLADPETVEAATGYPVGGVPPLCHDRELATLVDRSLLAHDTVWAAAGTAQAVFPIDPDRLAALADATVADIDRM